MNEAGYREFLQARDLEADEIDAAVELVRDFEGFVQAEHGIDSASAGPAEVDGFSKAMIETGRNTWQGYVALARYGLFIDNRSIYVAAVAQVDGAEAYGNFHEMLADAVGKEKRDDYFADAAVPRLGTSNTEKAALMGTVVDRLRLADPETCQQVLANGLRDLEDEWYVGEKERYEECGTVDAYLALRRAEFLAELEQHRDEGKWWWGQEVTDEVIDWVREHPEVGGGVREGRIVYEAKIPYAAKEHLAEDDQRRKSHYYCHCPWARESLLSDEIEVDPVFCNCSAAFHKKPWDVIFGRELQAEVLESVLAGDNWCKFAIHLPDDARLGDGAEAELGGE